MKILIAGGTSFVGRAIAHRAVESGHDVTVINRGRTPSDLPSQVEHLIGDRQGDLSALSGRHFDATVDTIAYRPSDVDALARALDGRGGSLVHISSVSAYAEPARANLHEDELVLHDVVDLDVTIPVTATSYGPLKAASELRADQLFERVTVLRPTYVVGAHDATLRFPYWVARARRGGHVVIPGPRDASFQWIDARDLAEFALRCLEHDLRGHFTVAGPVEPSTYVDALTRVITHCAPQDADVTVVDPELVKRANLTSKFPLWSGPHVSHMMSVSSSRAIEQGLALRSLEESVDDVQEWWADRSWPEHWLTPEEETQLLSEVG